MTADDNKLPKHHYIPVFYLREWTNDRGRMVEFSRPTGEQVAPRYCAPKGTGYVRGLYRVLAADEVRAEQFERFFFSFVDNQAKSALDMLMGRKPMEFTVKTRSAWTRFLLGMIYRNPERISAVRQYVQEVALETIDEAAKRYGKADSDLETKFLDMLIHSASFHSIGWTQTVMNNENVGKHINNMLWDVRDISGSGLTLFTSDRPIVMTNGLSGDQAHLVMPISPKVAFIACNSEDVRQKILTAPIMNFVRVLNESVLKYAKRYAWNVDDMQINKAERWLSTDSETMESFFHGAPNRALAQLKSKQSRA